MINPDAPQDPNTGSPNFINKADFSFGFQPINGKYPTGAPGAVAVQSGDTLESIAHSAFGDSKLWYLIAEANGLSGNADLRVGQTLTIPNRVSTIHNDNKTFKPYDPSAIIGDTTPNLPVPQADSGGGCGGLGTIIMVAVAVVATVFTAGAAAIAGAAMVQGVGAMAALAEAGFSGIMAAGGAALTGGVAAGAVGMTISPMGDIDSFFTFNPFGRFSTGVGHAFTGVFSGMAHLVGQGVLAVGDAVSYGLARADNAFGGDMSYKPESGLGRSLLDRGVGDTALDVAGSVATGTVKSIIGPINALYRQDAGLLGQSVGDAVLFGATASRIGQVLGAALRVSEFALDAATIERIQTIPKGTRPDPATYMPAEVIDAQLSMFDKGASRITTQSTLSKWGPAQADGTSFVMTKQQTDSLLKSAGGDPRSIEAALGLPRGLLDSDQLVRIDIQKPRELGLRIPNGNEAGANRYWIPGGKLPSGNLEAVIDLGKAPASMYSVKPLKF
ncbi:LysM peptidoglycan-binding domain-containing protein [Pandoraea pneumonica]|uniref:LysM peptidoglycan-binding domain-containing protein n=1 Tax=Pandoraea pneumonica TaxID=2508299 RepID=UPI003CECB93F